jgi:hypothetical protein
MFEACESTGTVGYNTGSNNHDMNLVVLEDAAFRPGTRFRMISCY